MIRLDSLIDHENPEMRIAMANGVIEAFRDLRESKGWELLMKGVGFEIDRLRYLLESGAYMDEWNRGAISALKTLAKSPQAAEDTALEVINNGGTQ